MVKLGNLGRFVKGGGGAEHACKVDRAGVVTRFACALDELQHEFVDGEFGAGELFGFVFFGELGVLEGD
jgi:hypothetical protein